MSLRDARAEFETHYLAGLLTRHKGSVARASQEAGISRARYYELLKQYGIRTEDE